MANATKGFRRALLAAAQQAHQEGRINGWELLRIRTAAAFAPAKLRQAQETVVDQACAAGLMGDGDGESEGFDWASLMSLIVELLPLILQLKLSLKKI